MRAQMCLRTTKVLQQTEEGLGFAAPDKRMQMLADIAARAGAKSAAQDVNNNIPGSFFGAVSCVCHFFTEMNLEETDGPKTPKLTTIKFQVEVDSDLGKEKAHREWIRRVRMTPTVLHFRGQII